MNIDERIELFRDAFQKLIQDSGLSISVLYYVVSGCFQDIKSLYIDHQQEIIQSINQQYAAQTAQTESKNAQEEA